MTITPLNSYAEVQAFITQVMTQNNEEAGVPNSPHGAFWANLSYTDFVDGNVPGVTDPTTGQPMGAPPGMPPEVAQMMNGQPPAGVA